MFEQAVTRQAVPRSPMPADIGGIVACLASDAAATITGRTICADGGSPSESATGSAAEPVDDVGERRGA